MPELFGPAVGGARVVPILWHTPQGHTDFLPAALGSTCLVQMSSANYSLIF
jgi:hypothetical protein